MDYIKLIGKCQTQMIFFLLTFIFYSITMRLYIRARYFHRFFIISTRKRLAMSFLIVLYLVAEVFISVKFKEVKMKLRSSEKNLNILSNQKD